MDERGMQPGHDIEALERWFEAEAEDRDDAAEAALTALFAALPAPAPSPRLSRRLAQAAGTAAAGRRAALRTPVLGMPRRRVERLAAALLLATGLAAFAVQALFRDVAGPALAGLRPARVISSAAEVLFSIVSGVIDWVETSFEVLQGLTRLSGAAATVAGSPPVMVALGAGLLLAVFAFKLLRDLIGKERGLSHVERD